MIIIGYQGIGKSTLAGTSRYVDLESGNFWVNGTRAADWYIPYCQIAVHLSQQGFLVFVSSHEVVRKQLRDCGETVLVCYPCLGLKDEWIDKLQLRYNCSGLEKDYKALMNAKDRYFENINELMCESKFQHVVLDNMDYDLDKLIFDKWLDIVRYRNRGK